MCAVATIRISCCFLLASLPRVAKHKTTSPRRQDLCCLFCFLVVCEIAEWPPHTGKVFRAATAAATEWTIRKTADTQTIRDTLTDTLVVVLLAKLSAQHFFFGSFYDPDDIPRSTRTCSPLLQGTLGYTQDLAATATSKGCCLLLSALLHDDECLLLQSLSKHTIEEEIDFPPFYFFTISAQHN